MYLNVWNQLLFTVLVTQFLFIISVDIKDTEVIELCDIILLTLNFLITSK